MVDYEKLTIFAASFQRKEKQQQLGPFSQLLFSLSIGIVWIDFSGVTTRCPKLFLQALLLQELL